ncbi:hypothetical protein ACHAWO_013815 [Cyclotella atomus]|uniref:Uncharacterized protein n=1 Tax=Cyclotella atomus TaxID=382360 RepID=A0ABD3QJW0_9STRA
MEKEFSTEWQSVLDAIIQRLLNEAEKKVLELRTTACQSLANSLRQNGFDAARLASMLNTANRSATSALKSAFHRMQVLAVVKEKMRATYEACVNVERGCGRFDRMKNAMATSSQDAIRGMFNDASSMLLKGIQEIVDKLKGMILATSEVFKKAIDSVFSILWDTGIADKSAAMIDPEMMKKIRDCRNALLPHKYLESYNISPFH